METRTKRRLPTSQGLVLNSCHTSTKGGKVTKTKRDCREGQGPFCTLQEPCTPCSAGGCRGCEVETDKNCHFVQGVGPYCQFGSTRDTIGPCTQCCS